MEITANQKISQEAGSALQLKRPLLPIDEYATRERVPRDILEECGKLGIIQIRKHKGKMFVVDVPLSPYLYISETFNEPTTTTQKAAKIESPPELIQTPELEAPQTPDESPAPVNESIDTKETSELNEMRPPNISHPNALYQEVRSKHAWQATTVISLAFLFIIVSTNLLFYMNWKAQLNRLNQAQTGIQKAYNGLVKANLRAETLQNQLDKSRAEVKMVRNELARAKQNLETIQKHNSDAVEQLNEQIQKLTIQLTELTSPSQTPPGSGI